MLSNTVTRIFLFSRVLEANDLTVINGACNPYAAVTLCRQNGKHKDKEDVKKTVVKKKTICPAFEEVFLFYVSSVSIFPPSNLKATVCV